MPTKKEDTPDPDATADAAEDTIQEEGVTLEIPPAKETAASLLLRNRNNTRSRRTLTKYDLDGNGLIDPEEAQLMAQDLNAANEQVAVVEKDKNKYKQFFKIAAILLLLTLVANFGLTIATIYLTRQFDIQDGVLVDRSTGKQVTTKAHGNVIGATLFGEVDGAGRRLNNNLCFATVSMNEDTQDETFNDFLNGNKINYIVTANGAPESGELTFLAVPESFEFLNPDDLANDLAEVDLSLRESYWFEAGALLLDSQVPGCIQASRV